MDRDFRHIQMVRRLVRAGRYNEARVIMKETNHPQIPALEKQVSRLEESEIQNDVCPPIITRMSLMFGISIGLFFVIMGMGAGTRNLPFLAVCFVLGFGFGVVMPEHERRRGITRDKYMKAFFKSLNSPRRR